MDNTIHIDRDKILEAMKDLPEHDALPEAMERLYVLYKIEQGLADAEAGRVISHEEAKERLRKWLV